MIKPTELRIGNLVYAINRSGPVHIPELPAFKIVTLGLFKAEILLPELNPANIAELPKKHYSDLSPILLTEEILLKAGCIKGHKKNFYWREHLLFEVFNVTALENGEKFIAGRLSKNAIIAVSKEIKYVHQLQNIHFSLTETELQINL